MKAAEAAALAQALSGVDPSQAELTGSVADAANPNLAPIGERKLIKRYVYLDMPLIFRTDKEDAESLDGFEEFKSSSKHKHKHKRKSKSKKKRHDRDQEEDGALEKSSKRRSDDPSDPVQKTRPSRRSRSPEDRGKGRATSSRRSSEERRRRHRSRSPKKDK